MVQVGGRRASIWSREEADQMILTFCWRVSRDWWQSGIVKQKKYTWARDHNFQSCHLRSQLLPFCSRKHSDGTDISQSKAHYFVSCRMCIILCLDNAVSSWLHPKLPSLVIRKKRFALRMVKHWHRLPRLVIGVLYLATFQVRLDRVLSNLICLNMSLLTVGKLN